MNWMKCLLIPDIVILSLPLTKESWGLFSLNRLKLIGPKGFIINVSRGAIVVEKDLKRALKKRILLLGQL